MSGGREEKEREGRGGKLLRMLRGGDSGMLRIAILTIYSSCPQVRNSTASTSQRLSATSH